MNRQELRSTVLAKLVQIAPEVEADQIEDKIALRKQVDLDSLDWLNFLISLHKALDVDIPESDYGKLVTLANLLDYLQAKLA